MHFTVEMILQNKLASVNSCPVRKAAFSQLELTCPLSQDGLSQSQTAFPTPHNSSAGALWHLD